MKIQTLLGSSKTLIMGIVNITEDSFSGDGVTSFKDSVRNGEELILQGADILDIGGESSRPGATPISLEEELKRVIPVVEYFAKKDIVISVDTCKPEVADKALVAGAQIINDITGLAKEEMAKIVARRKAKIVIMHMKGNPETMQQNPIYENIIEEIVSFFEERIERALKAGIARENIILDPGIGFGKTLEHNLIILKNLDYFRDKFSLPMLIGTSRKSFIGTLTGKNNPGDRVFGTAATIALAISKGAGIVRVHDVKEMKDVALIADAIEKQKSC